MITVTLAMSLPAAAPSGPPLLAGSQRNGVVRCATGYSPKRLDSLYCSSSCRQRALAAVTRERKLNRPNPRLQPV
jgi:hypothetical protein